MADGEGALKLWPPLVFEPMFNRFRPLADERLAAELRALADAADVPVRDVLVADASRRTTKSNAYVSGIGPRDAYDLGAGWHDR